MFSHTIKVMKFTSRSTSTWSIENVVEFCLTGVAASFELQIRRQNHSASKRSSESFPDAEILQA